MANMEARLKADLMELVEQTCSHENSDLLSSRFTTAHARAMRTLAELGEITVTSDDGGRQVTGRWARRFRWRDRTVHAPKTAIIEKFCQRKGIKFTDITDDHE